MLTEPNLNFLKTLMLKALMLVLKEEELEEDMMKIGKMKMVMVTVIAAKESNVLNNKYSKPWIVFIKYVLLIIKNNHYYIIKNPFRQWI